MVLSSVNSKLVIVAAIVTWNLTCVADEEANRLRVIAESTMANRKAFPHIDCRFVLVHGKCDKDKDPLESGHLRDELEGSGVWIVRKDQIRYEINVDPTLERECMLDALTRGAAKANAKNEPIRADLGMRFVSRKKLWDGVRGMSYSPGLGGGGLFPPDKSGPGITMTPFDLAGMMGPDEVRHPGYLIEETQHASAGICRFVGNARIRGRDLLVVSYDETLDTENVHTKYWFDPGRGFLPVQMTRESDNPERVRRKAVVTDARECSGKRWFPMRTVRINSPGPAQTDREIQVYQLTVQELDVDTPPSDELLALEIPEGARLHNSVSPQSQRTLQEDQRISVADLGGVKEDMRSKAEERRRQRDQLERPLDQSAPGWNRLLIVFSAVLLIIVTLALLRLHRH